MITVTLPWPPTVNHYWVRKVSGAVYISPRGRRFRETVALELLAQGVKLLEGPVSLDIVAHPPDKRRRDLDNLLKALLDALEHGGALKNDSQVCALRIVRGAVDRPLGGVDVTIEAATAAWCWPIETDKEA